MALRLLVLALVGSGCSYDTDSLRRPGASGGDGGGSGSGGAGGGGAVTECDEVASTGCAAGERCTICLSATTSRSQGCAAGGNKAAGELCAAQAECAPGTVCWNADSGSGFVCRRYCNTDGDCPATAPSCKGFADYKCDYLPGVTANFGLCYAAP